jgi:methionine-rich copper-binding protein CopC
VTVVSGADGVADSNGDNLSSDVTSSFITEAPLSVVSVTPADGSTGVAINSAITVQFDNAMNADTLGTGTLVLQDSAGNTIATSVSYDADTDTATITPSAVLANSTTYTLTVEGGADGVADTGGDTLSSDFTASFTTVALPTVVAVAPPDNATTVSAGSAVNVTFSEAMNADTITSDTLRLEDLEGNVVASTVSYDSGSNTATITPTVPLAAGATYLVYVEGGSSGVADTSGDSMADNFASSFTISAGVAAPQPSPGQSTLWSNSIVPPYSDNPDTQSVELGVQFQASTDGYITGIRFYKGASSSGTNIGNLWSSDGTLLATATFTNETASGWEQVDFSEPVAITANTTYIASYFAPTGNYADNLTFFASGSYTSGPLTALGSVYVYSADSAFPTQTYEQSNYYVDLVFSQLIGTISPTSGATGVATSSPITVQFLASMNSSTIDATTLQLEDSSGTLVPATVTFDSASDTATLTPGAALDAGAQYTVVITGGSGGVADADGNTLSANVTWSFTTAPTAPAVLSTTPASAATGVDVDASIQIQFNEAMNAATLTADTLLLQDSLGDNVAATISYDSNTHTATLVPDAPLNTSATYTIVVESGVDGVADSNGNTMSANYTSTFTTAAPLNAGSYSLWTSSTTPEWIDNPDPRSVELGVEFQSTSGGEITGISFYQSAENTGSHTVNLWSSAGTLLATATSSSTSGPGWVTIDFAQPVYIEANTTYVASYFTSVGNYSDNIGYFTGGSHTNGPLTAIAGVYNYGSQSAFPTEVYNGSNYWVDVVLTVPTSSASATNAAVVASPAIVTAGPAITPAMATSQEVASPAAPSPAVSSPAIINAPDAALIAPPTTSSDSSGLNAVVTSSALQTSTPQADSTAATSTVAADSTLTSVNSLSSAQNTVGADSQTPTDQTADADLDLPNGQ